MSDDSPKHIEDESTYSKLEIPTFKSDIPEPLLMSASDETKYILEQLSILSQYAKWSAPVLIDSNLQSRKTNGRLMRVEAWKAMFSSWWALALGLFAVIGGIAGVVEVLNFIQSHHLLGQ